jgi:hypothetical protein
MGMRVSTFRRVVCWAMISLLPSSLLAADGNPAILHSKGQVWVNGKDAADSTAIMPGDVLETDVDVAVNLTTDGSMITIQERSLVKYNGDSLSLEHGGVSVGTSKSMSVDVDCLRVVPVVNEWTQYEVTNVNGQVKAAARKLDVNLVRGATARKPAPEQSAKDSGTVREGEEATRDLAGACGAAAIPANVGNPVNGKLIGIGAGAGGGLLLCLLLCLGKSSPQMSQTTP